MAQTTRTVKVDPQLAPTVKQALVDAGFELSTAPYAFFRAKGAGLTATFYEKGKLVLQGADIDLWAERLTGQGVPEDSFVVSMRRHPEPPPACWIGIDEAGKGDYFGPLVVVAAAIRRDQVPLIRELGVDDSKRLSDKKALELARELKAVCRFSQVVIGPERYNALYSRIGNLNRLLGWGHATALEGALEYAPDATWALSDQFATDPNVILSQRKERGRAIELSQWTKAESDPAVAAASVIARAEFLWQLRNLGQVAGQQLPKGAGGPVLAAAREIVAREGRGVLERIAKLHFRTTEQL
jgi:ribonuclease HIII